MVSDEVAEMFKEALGLDAATIGSLAIERALRERLSASALQDTHDYCERVRTSGSELQALIEAVVVPETWFFRDREAFVELARVVVRRCRAHANRTLRLLSLPCSTGEEPYSMAMALLGAGVDPNRFDIDAVDISHRALERARRAVYGNNSFRGDDLEFRERYFDATPDGFRLHDAVRRPVHFSRANLVADFVPPAEQYDVIFCRNLFIYFDRPTQERAITIVQRLLKPGGTIFVGPAESNLLFAHGFVWSKVPLAFAFIKPVPVVPVVPDVPDVPVVPDVPSVPSRVRPHDASRPPAYARPHAQAATELIDLDDAARLADLGRFVEAAQACDAYVRARGPCAEAAHLMGLISSADGKLSEAARYFRQALYLEPARCESAIHLALLLEKQGDTAGAQRLRSRARRVRVDSAN